MEFGKKLITENLDVWTSAVKAKSSVGKGSVKKRELYGIARLRGLILDLAVRGLLVPHDSTDEPASALLKGIANEKSELINAGKIKKQKEVPEVSEDEKQFDIPRTWKWVRLKNIAILENGDRSKNYPNKSALVDRGIPFVNAGDLQKGRINRGSTSFITENRFDLLKAGKFENGDILFCLRGSLGKSAIVDGFERGAIASSLVIVRLLGGVDHFYAHHFLNSPFSYGLIKLYDNGTAQPNLSAADLGRFTFPLPPLAEQHRIAAKVDELMALCNQLEQEQESSLETHDTLVTTILDALTNASANASAFAEAWQRIQANFDTLFTTESSIDQLKQTILQLAVMGKLVEQESETCTRRSLGSILSEPSYNGISTGPTTDTSATEVLRISAGTSRDDFYVEESDFKHVDISPKDLRKATLRQGDLLACRYNGNLHYVGRFSIYRATRGRSQVNPDKLIRFRVNNESYSPRYVCLAMNAAQTRQVIEGMCATTAGNIGLSAAKIKTVQIPLPPLSEQNRIVAKVDELMALCERLKAGLADAQATQLDLADSLAEQTIG